jgi:hypothetical protein
MVPNVAVRSNLRAVVQVSSDTLTALESLMSLAVRLSRSAFLTRVPKTLCMQISPACVGPLSCVDVGGAPTRSRPAQDMLHGQRTLVNSWVDFR